MKLNRKHILSYLSLLFLILGVLVLVLSISRSGVKGYTSRSAARASKVLDKRVDVLDEHMLKALEGRSDEWLSSEGLPKDFVIYRYYSDTLQSWVGEFPVANDRINSEFLFPFLSNPRRSIASPLTSATDSLTFLSFGRSWYLVKKISEGDCTVIGGISIMGGSRGQADELNRNLRINSDCSVRPLSYDCGSVVKVGGVPMFKVVCETLKSSGEDDSSSLWLSMGLMILAVFLFLLDGRSARRVVIAVSSLAALMSVFYFWGKSFSGQYTLFSPVLYAGGDVLYSLASVLIINLAIFLLSLCLYLCRKQIDYALKSRRGCIAVISSVLVFIALILFYTQYAFRDIVINSNICLELYKFSQISPFSFTCYISFGVMLISVPMLLDAVSPLVGRVFDFRYNCFSPLTSVLFSLAFALLLVVTSSVLGFRKEKEQMDTLAGRLSFDRDITLEMRLRSIEGQIADDMIISALSVFNNTESAILSRITDTYLSRSDQDYQVTVYVFNNDNNTRAAAQLYNSLLKDAVPIADGSRFMYVKREGSGAYYIGLFMYLIEGSGISRVLVQVESRDIRGNKGYAAIFNITPPGRATIPNGYSYARYEALDLKSNYGQYPYPTKLTSGLADKLYSRHDMFLTLNGHTHFFTLMSDREMVVLSRQSLTLTTYIVTVVFIAIMMSLPMWLFAILKRGKRKRKNRYFRRRIVSILLVSLVLTLVVMAFVSVFFVYKRNDSNLHTMMSYKINSISAMMDASSASVQSELDITGMDFRRAMEQVGTDTSSDISVYSPSGRLIMSTTPIVFERQLLGQRLNSAAYNQIVHQYKKYYIQKEKAGSTHYYSMYAPVRNRSGRLVAIICSPYSDASYDLERDAVVHSMTVLSLFITLLSLALAMSSRVVDRMFSPLEEMGSKMKASDVESLQLIKYDREDEISDIVKAYNRMVAELQESSRKVVQAERDKAWNGMARQVAHEIKNPLTPMKLKIQRLVRLKEKGDPRWMEYFDETARLLIEQIDILSATANEFSTFANLDREQPQRIDLGSLLKDQISLFDTLEGVKFEYLGLEHAYIDGPRPQLTRVFVNLLNNAVQAIDKRPDGLVLVSLRNSVEDGYYDIVVEDNGPGVSEENICKLFTPNFTTKNSGTGLGLAISRIVLERCAASISYSSSFSLGGACFTIKYPKS